MIHFSSIENLTCIILRKVWSEETECLARPWLVLWPSLCTDKILTWFVDIPVILRMTLHRLDSFFITPYENPSYILSLNWLLLWLPTTILTRLLNWLMFWHIYLYYTISKKYFSDTGCYILSWLKFLPYGSSFSNHLKLFT